MNPPRGFVVKSNRFEDWEKSLTNNIIPGVKLVILLLPSKKTDPLYKQLKTLMFTKIPVPSQVVLTKTLNGKNLRSIISKIVIQIVAKIGGVPWKIDKISALSHQTMVCGLDINELKGGPVQSIIGFISSIDSN